MLVEKKKKKRVRGRRRRKHAEKAERDNMEGTCSHQSGQEDPSENMP